MLSTHFGRMINKSASHDPARSTGSNSLRGTISMTIYYVYAYLRKDGTPYYIGKGKNTRAYDKHGSINLPTDKRRIVFLEQNLTNIGACAIERRMISWYGRKDLGTGILLNRTDGGDGGVGQKFGFKPTAESKKKISSANKGKRTGELNPFFGKDHSEDTKQKYRDLFTSVPLTESHRRKISEGLKGKPTWNKGLTQPRVCCCLCQVEVDRSNFNKHYESRKCLIKAFS